MERQDEAKWDNDMGFLLKVAERYMHNLTDKADVDLCGSWIDKLTNDAYVDNESKKRRNIYLTNLIQSMERGRLDGPFGSPPPRRGEGLEHTQHAFSRPSAARQQVRDTSLRKDAGDFNSSMIEGNTYVATKTLPNGRGAFGFVAVSLEDSDVKVFRQESKKDIRTRIGPNVVRQQVRQKYTKYTRPRRHDRVGAPPTPPNYSPVEMPIFSSRVDDSSSSYAPSFYNLSVSPIGTEPRQMRSFGTRAPLVMSDTTPSLSFGARARKMRAARPVDVTPLAGRTPVLAETPVRGRRQDVPYGTPVRRPRELFAAGAPGTPARRPEEVYVGTPVGTYLPRTPDAPIARPTTPPRVRPGPGRATRIPQPRQTVGQAYEETPQRREHAQQNRPVRGRARGIETRPEPHWSTPLMGEKDVDVDPLAGQRHGRAARERATPNVEDLMRSTRTEHEGFIEEPSSFQTGAEGGRTAASTQPKRPEVISTRETEESIVIEPPAAATTPTTPKRDEQVVRPGAPKKTLKEKIMEMAPCLADKKHGKATPDKEPHPDATDGEQIVLWKNVKETVQQKRDRDDERQRADRARRDAAEPERIADVSKEEYWKQFEHVDVRKQMEQRPKDIWGDIIRRGYKETASEAYVLPDAWRRHVDAPLDRKHVDALNETYPKALVDKFVELLGKQKAIIAAGKQKEFEADARDVVAAIDAQNAERIEIRKDVERRYAEMKDVVERVRRARTSQSQQVAGRGRDDGADDDVGRAEDELQRQEAYADHLRGTIRKLAKDHDIDMQLYEESILKHEKENRRLQKRVEMLKGELSTMKRRLDALDRTGSGADAADTSASASPPQQDEGWW